MAANDATFAGKHDSCLWIDAGKETHRTCVVDLAGAVLSSKPIANAESELDALMGQCPDDTLVVVDRRRNIGALALRRASMERAKRPR